jgi:hypothetical protein
LFSLEKYKPVTFSREKHLTILSYDGEDKRGDQESGRSIGCQISLSKVFEKGLGRHLRISKGTRVEDQRVNDVSLFIPTDVYIPGLVTTVPFIDYILPIEDFSPSRLIVCGARKVGSILGENKKTVLLLEVEMDTPENTTREEESTINESECE